MTFAWDYQVWREKNILKPAPGKRRCNCRNEVYHKQIGPGMFQQMTEQVYNAIDALFFFFFDGGGFLCVASNYSPYTAVA